jgi:hypothetical protein
MSRMLLAIGALSAVAMMMPGAASASPATSRNVAPPAASDTIKATSAVPWHYEWQYHYGKAGEYVPGWVAVFDNAH